MKIGNKILENISNSRDEFYYKANDVEQELFALRDLTDSEDTINKIEKLIVELNNIRMEEYKGSGQSLVKKFIDLPYGDFGASNTIGELNDGRVFVITDFDSVFVFDVEMTLDELKAKLYGDDDELNDFADEHATRLSDNEASGILREIELEREER